MIHLVGAVTLILLSILIAVIVAATADISAFVDVMVVCRQLVETPTECTQHAIQTGLVGCGAAIILLILLLAACRRIPATSTLKVGGLAFLVVGLGVVGVIAYSTILEVRSPWPIYREDIFKYYSPALSLGNLIWPLCLQFTANSINPRWKLAFFVLLAPLVAFSPFRGMIFAVAVFGVFLPVLEYALALAKQNKFARGQIVACGLFLLLAVTATVAVLAIETNERKTRLKTGDSVFSQITEKIGQRVAIPLFQSHYAERHVLDTHLPSLTDEILTKLRIQDRTSINGFLYAKSHNGDNFGETTSLYYGEAVLRTTSSPIVWSVAGPFLLVLTWLGLRRLGFETGVITGLAMWRGSLGGVIGIVPAYVIQLVVLVALTKLDQRKLETELK